MAERIVSPGVFTRERDLSFLPAGIAEIGAAIIGPTSKGPSFVPTVVRSFEEFREVFGGYSTDYYTPYAVREYFRGNAGSVTIVKVGYIGGYTAPTVNLISSGSESQKLIIGTLAPSALNSSGLGSISASIVSGYQGSLTLQICGQNATASIAGVSLISGGDGTIFSEAVGSEAKQPTIGSTAAPAYVFKDFGSSQLSTSAANTSASLEVVAGGADFSTGTETVNSTTYVSTINGSSNATAARTPFIQSQAPAQNLFKIYSRVDGAASNTIYAVIRDIVRPQNSNTSPEYAMFTIDINDVNHNTGDVRPLESFSNVNLDPASARYLPKVVGDQFQTVTTAGEVVIHGEYPNLSRYVRIGDYDENLFKGNKSLMPMGHASLISPIKAGNNAHIPSASFSLSQTRTVSDTTSYNGDVPYGFKLNTSFFNLSELGTNHAYQSAIPAGAVSANNVAFALENMYGFGTMDTTETERSDHPGFVTSSLQLTTVAPKIQLKFAVPMQYGFDGVNPSVTKNTGGDITATNVMGFDCSAAAKSGSVAYRRAIATVSNPDEIDINMLVTPGIMHSLHPSVTNYAIDKVESRADCFYVMDSAQWADNVQTAVSNVSTLDTNYVATYYPWVKMDDPDTGVGVWVPPSVVIPGVMAFTDSVAHEWFAPAGLNRGGLTSVRVPKKKLTHTDRDTLYEGRVNPIATFPGQGVVVFGQKTLQAKPSALDRINVRRLLIRLKKFIASSSRFLVFEQNDSSTRARFLNIVNPFLESVQANSGLSAFKVVMDDSNNTPDVIDRNQMVGQIFIQPTRTAEFIVLDFTVLPTGAAFPE
tara:strand:+ start:800 stop:3250 length:2451 start_codon:yes stop_codon:yes gene_type:complete